VAVHFDSLQSVHVVAAGYALAALGVGALVVASHGLRAATAVCLLAALALAGYGIAEARGTSRFVSALERARPNLEVTFHRPGLQGVTTVIRRTGEPLGSVLLVNAQGMTAKLTDTKMMAHLPLLVHPKPANTLVICFGMGTTFRAALSHGGKVTAVELVPEVLEAFDQFFGDAEQVRRNPNGRMVANDGRNFLKLTRERYDVITVDPPPPIDAAGVTNLYSQEFVALARERLAPGGIFAHWLPFPGTGSGIESVQTFRMLLKTITLEFPHVLVAEAINGVGLHVLASEQPIAVDLDAIAARLGDPAVAADLNEWQPVPLAFFRRLEPPSQLDFVLQRPPRRMRIHGSGLESVAPLTDDRPRLEFDLWWSLRNGQPKYQPSIWAG
jgi:spermidine synthase